MIDTRANTAYELLSVHPWAPAELVTASYWWHAGELQRLRGSGYSIDAALHGLTRAYEMISEARARAAYNEAISYKGQPLIKRPLHYKRLPFTRRVLLRQQQVLDVDYYEALALAPSAPEAMIAEASRIMRNQYLRLSPESKRRRELLLLLDEAIATLLNPEKRAKYDALLTRRFGYLYDGQMLALAEAEPRQVWESEDVDAPVPDAVSGAFTEEPAQVPVVEEPDPASELMTADTEPAVGEPPSELPHAEPQPAAVGTDHKPVSASEPSTPATHGCSPTEAGTAAGDEALRPTLMSKVAPVAASLVRVTGRGMVMTLRAVWRGARLLAKQVRKATTRPPVEKPEPMSTGSPKQPVLFGRPVRRSDVEVEEVFLRRLATSVKAVNLAPPKEAVNRVNSPES
jgi:hypothetical protein